MHALPRLSIFAGGNSVTSKVETFNSIITPSNASLDVVYLCET